MKLLIENWVDDYYGNTDYKTGDIRWLIPNKRPYSDIFDTSTLGGYSNLSDYMNEKDKYIQYVTPKEYFEQCAKGFKNTFDDQIRQVEQDDDVIDYLTRVIMEKGKKFPMAYISKSDGSRQEGRHRMYVAAQLFGWNKSFPVLVID